LKSVKEHYGDINSTVGKLTLWAIQLIIAISVFQFLRIVFFYETADWEPGMVLFGITLLAAIAASLLLWKYQKQVKEFSLQKESLEEVVRAEEERRKLEAKM
jgi:uncharacterized membrane protein YqhA